MSGSLEALTQLLNLAPEKFAILVVLLMFLNSAIMVPPSEYVCAAVGLYCKTTNVPLEALFFFVLVLAAANLLGTLPWYLAGTRALSADPWLERFGSPGSGLRHAAVRIAGLYRTSLAPITDLYRRRGPLVVVLFRCFPVIRSIASYPAGLIRMPIWQFVAATYCGMFFWCSVWTAAGYVIGRLSGAEHAVGLAGIGIVAFAIFQIFQRWLP